MPKARLNPMFRQFYGRLGDIVFRRSSKDGESIATHAPNMSKVEWSEAQVAHRKRFRRAVIYARRVSADPQARAVYEEMANQQGRIPFRLMLADAMHPPTVKKVDLSQFHEMAGDPIYIHACDDFGVIHVTVTITDANGTCLEKGNAMPASLPGTQWVYRVQGTFPPDMYARVTVTAEDRARGVGTWIEEVRDG